MAINGNNIIITKGGTAIAATKSHEIQSGCELIEISGPTEGSWREYIAGRKEWSINVNYLLLENSRNNVRDVLQVGNIVTLVIKDRSNSYSVTGTAICTACKQTYTEGNLAVGSFSFKGTGALS